MRATVTPRSRSVNAPGSRHRTPPDVRVVLNGLIYGAFGLGERALGGVGGLRERTAERGDEEVVGGLVEPERARLAGRADDAAGGAGEAGEVLALAAGRAGGELGREAGGEEELDAEGERVGAAGPLGAACRAA